MVKISWWRLVIDIGVLLVLVLFSQVALKFVEPHKAGFYCNDFSVNLPFRQSTVSNAVLAVISIVIPFVFMVGTELIRWIMIRVNRSKITGRKPIHYGVNACCWGQRNVPEIFGNFLANYGVFLLGLAVTNTLTNLTKVVIGRLRPNFLSVCQPTVDPYQLCGPTRTYLVPGVDFFCGNPDTDAVQGTRKSFPSGHSSLSFYSMIFLCLFIRQTWNCRHLGFFKYLVQVLLTCLALFTALSRVQDNKHHPTDVLAGSLIGILFAILSFLLLSKHLNRRHYKCEYRLVEDQEQSSNLTGNTMQHQQSFTGISNM